MTDQMWWVEGDIAEIEEYIESKRPSSTSIGCDRVWICLKDEMSNDDSNWETRTDVMNTACP